MGVIQFGLENYFITGLFSPIYWTVGEWHPMSLIYWTYEMKDWGV